MNVRGEKVEVAVEEVKESSPSTHSVVLETESRVDGALHDTAIKIRQDDVPAVALALLNTEVAEEGVGAALPDVVKCLGAGVVHGMGGDNVRFHLQFDSGQVLPVEMSRDAALVFARGLFQHVATAPGQ